MPLITCYAPAQNNGVIHSSHLQRMEITQREHCTCSNHALVIICTPGFGRQKLAVALMPRGINFDWWRALAVTFGNRGEGAWFLMLCAHHQNTELVNLHRNPSVLGHWALPRVPAPTAWLWWHHDRLHQVWVVQVALSGKTRDCKSWDKCSLM